MASHDSGEGSASLLRGHRGVVRVYRDRFDERAVNVTH